MSTGHLKKMAASTENTQLSTWNITDKQVLFPLSVLKKQLSNSKVSVPSRPPPV
jgi:hypothetical protein